MTPTVKASRRILILEDERPLYEILKLMLETRGWSCLPHPANARPHAITHAATPGPIDAALLDVNAGETNGMTVADELRRANPALPIVLMTGNTDRNLRERVAAMKHSAVLQKPFSISTLEEALSKALAG
jgi:DNA-binding response OmpR family regulator